MRASPAFPSTLVLVISLAWGLQEAVAGPLLRASPLGLAGGSILTGLSFVYLAAAFAVRPAPSTLPFLLIPVFGTKLAAAAILGLDPSAPHVVNPLFAYATTAAAFLLVARVCPVTHRKPAAQALAGAGAAALAVLLFPAAGLVTGAPACTIPGTSLPASFTFGPVAVVLAAAAVPAGIRIGRTLSTRAAAPRYSSGLAWCAAATAALQILLTVAVPGR